MKLSIACFGPARDITGTRQLEVDVPGVTNAGALRRYLLDTWPEFKSLDMLRVAVNQSYVEDEHPIKEGDELAVIPPVSGG
jgi:molybdopterin converting factor subunit 1